MSSYVARRIVFHVAILLLAGGVSLEPLYAAPRGKGQDAALKLDNVVIAAVPANWPPQYSLDTSGAPQGFAIDVLDHLAAQLDITVHYTVADTFTEATWLLDVFEADLIPNSGILKDRMSENLFSPPVETFQIVIFTRAGSMAITGIDAIQGKSVGVVQNNAGLHLLRNRKDLTLRVFQTPEEALLALLAGQVDAVAYPDSVFLAMARQLGVEDKVKIVGAPLKEVRRGLQFRKDSTDLHALFSAAVISFVHSPDYHRIYSKWYGAPKPYWTAGRVLRTMSTLLIVLIVIFAIWRYFSISTFNRKLKVTQLELVSLNASLEEQVEKRTHQLKEEIEEREQSQKDLETFFNQSQSLNLIVDFDGNILRLNNAWASFLGIDQNEFFKRPFFDFVHPEDREMTDQAFTAVINGQGVDGFENRYMCSDGQSRNLRWSARSDVKRRQVFAVAQDITDQKTAERALKLSASVFTAADEGILITDTSGTILDVNEAFTEITGYPREEVLGKTPNIMNSGQQSKTFYADMWKELEAEGVWRGEIWNQHKQGFCYPEMLTISSVEDAQGNTTNYIGLFSDITKLKAHEKELEHLARYDRLTSLPNRVLLADHLEQAMARARRHDKFIAVAFIDLDGFKAINDTYGHAAGDQLLVSIARRFKATLRAEDTLARIGGDEFVSVITDLPNEMDCLGTIERLLSAAAEQFELNETEVNVTASIGVTFYPQNEEIDGEQLERQADQAMYEAKLAGRNRYRFFDPAQNREMATFYAKVSEAQTAITRDEFCLYYQPKADLKTGQIVGCEALLRWQHPERGFLTPADFLPPIEKQPLVALSLGNWVLDRALQQMDDWRSEGLEIPVSVNASALQLMHPDFEDTLRQHLQNHPETPPDALEIEILETDALKDLEYVSSVIRNCREFGVHFALDDFGTGYSSLMYLKQLPINTLKIDQTFVRECLNSEQDRAILKTIISFGHIFNLDILAEGVETDALGDLLRSFGCRYAQGYAIAKPMPPEQFPAWYSQWASRLLTDRHPSRETTAAG